MREKSSKNWQDVANAYRAGTQSNRQIAKQFGIAESTLRKRIAAEKWVKKTVRKVRTPPTKRCAPVLKQNCAPQQPQAAVTAELPSTLEERLLILADSLTDELVQISASQRDLAELIEIETANDENPRRREAMLKAISHPVRASTLKTLTQTFALLGNKAIGKRGKKEQQKDAAESASSGRFAPMNQPKLVVNNGK